MVALPEHLQPAPAGRRRLSHEVVAEHQRDRVLAAAIEVIAKRGYNATTIDHIVAAAAIGVGTFYDLFDNKEDCFLQAYEQILGDATARIAASVPGDRPWPEQACAALRALLETIAAEQLQARLALVEVQTAGPRALARYEETIDSAIPLLARGREASALASELPSRLEEAIVGGLVWYLQQRLVPGEFEGVDAHLADLVEIVVEPYVGEAASAELLGGLGTSVLNG